MIERDHRLDALHREIEKKAIRLIALRQPVASDLRRTLAAMKLATDLERTGDLGKNIAKRGLVLAEGEPMPPRRSTGPSQSGTPTTRSTSTTTACSASC